MNKLVENLRVDLIIQFEVEVERGRKRLEARFASLASRPMQAMTELSLDRDILEMASELPVIDGVRDMLSTGATFGEVIEALQERLTEEATATATLPPVLAGLKSLEVRAIGKMVARLRSYAAAERTIVA